MGYHYKGYLFSPSIYSYAKKLVPYTLFRVFLNEIKDLTQGTCQGTRVLVGPCQGTQGTSW